MKKPGSTAGLGAVMKNAVIVVLALVVVFLADRLVRTENQRYALLVGVCKQPDPASPASAFQCLESIQTRTSWFWHLYYGVTNHLPAVPVLGSD